MTTRIAVGDEVQSIDGWGLNNPDPEYYTLRETGEYAGFCQSDTCAHYSHDPYGPITRLTLKASELPENDVRPGTPNKIIYLGDTGDDSWYTGPSSGEFLRVRFALHYNERAEIVGMKDAPLSIEQAYFGK